MKRMTPHPHTSTGLPYGSLFTTSGAMKWGVPTRPADSTQQLAEDGNGLGVLLARASDCFAVVSQSSCHGWKIGLLANALNVRWHAWVSSALSPPATRPDSPSWMATPKPPSLTGAEFSFEAKSTQWGCKGEKHMRSSESNVQSWCLALLALPHWK